MAFSTSSTQTPEESLPSTNEFQIPLLSIPHSVLFPHTYLTIAIEGEATIEVIKKVHQQNSVIGVVAQKKENPIKSLKDIFEIGTTAHILRLIMVSESQAKILVHGQERFQINTLLATNPHLIATATKLHDKLPDPTAKQTQKLSQLLKETVSQLAAIHPEFPSKISLIVDNLKDFSTLTYFLALGLDVDLEAKQQLLTIHDAKKRATLLLKHLEKDVQTAQLKKKIHDKIHHEVGQIQRDFYIRRQIKALQEELGEKDTEDEVDELRARGQKKAWSQEVQNYFYKSLDKAERMGPHSSDYTVLINHAELLLELPWNTYTTDNTNLAEATKILNTDHYGIDKVKERLLEYLASTQLKKTTRGPILCLYGPPGVGKTTLGKSIAKALHRKYAKVALGGMNDEAEIRGHRKTYVGAMPGRIIRGIEGTGVSNPVLLLDEIDKINDTRGDPAAALLEVLDPEQNHAFVDNFLEVPYDLSKVLFIATANQLDTIPHALCDRLELIELTGYTLEEKLQIAKKYLFPKQRKGNGVKAKQLTIEDAAIVKIIENYTRESGVRELERKLARIIRKICKAMVMSNTYPKRIREQDIIELLGIAEFERETYQANQPPGVALGLAWTPAGGDVLFIEAALTPGKEKLTLSGQLGNVMKESAITALTYLKAHASLLAIPIEVFENYDLHIHIPAGATPKDGPSAGITLFTALASLYTQRRVKEKLAMTGEITLRGKVLPVGGIKEKVLAAKRFGIKEIILSEENKKDIKEIKSTDLFDINFKYINTIEEIIPWALDPEKVTNPIMWDLQKKNNHPENK
jgi:ATP-dependent Lon protease